MGKVHFIAIGGSVMHRLAIALKYSGWVVTGSDDAIYGAAKSNLEKEGLLPEKEGWDVSAIHSDLDFVIIGMHARQDNPELLKAEELGVKVMSFPDFIYMQSLNKQRIVIGGSHGKTTITSILLQILKNADKEFDYVVGASVKGFEDQVKLTDAPVIIIEGDEYLSSPVDRVPKFLKYNHHIGLISGISWDHANVFPTEDDYVKQFDLFADKTPKSGCLVFNEEDAIAQLLGSKERTDVTEISYNTLPYSIKNGITVLKYKNLDIPLKIFGKHNISNISGALKITERLGISPGIVKKSLENFEGADKRCEIIYENESKTILSDFAHAPSKVKATVEAVREQYPQRTLISCLELHTFSSLDKSFLGNYKDTMTSTDIAVVFFEPKNVENKKLPALTKQDISDSLNRDDIVVFTETDDLKRYIIEQFKKNSVLLLMSSGTFGSLNISELSKNT